jgi:hypothetical protein
MQSKSAVPNNNSPIIHLQFLSGDWQADSDPGEPTGEFAFNYQLQGYVMVRTNHADYPASDERDAFRHEDLMIIYSDEKQSLKADYFDSEGHTIRYIGQINGVNQVVFTSNPEQDAPAFRLSYRLDEQGKLHGTFEMAPPSKPKTFQSYLTWSAHKQNKSR